MEQKEYRFETHCHTKETSPCSTLPAEELVRLYQEAGYDGMVITDHFTAGLEGGNPEITWQAVIERFLTGFRAAEQAGKQLGITVFLGAEIRFPHNGNDYLVFGLTEKLLKENEWLYRMELPAFYRFAEEHGLLVVQAHPFRTMCTPADPQYLHGMEVHNGHKGHENHNEQAQALAEAHGLIPTAGSDCHYPEMVGTAAVCFKKQPQSIQDIVTLLKNGEYRLEKNRK